jgi:hypothetical protein
MAKKQDTSMFTTERIAVGNGTRMRIKRQSIEAREDFDFAGAIVPGQKVVSQSARLIKFFCHECNPSGKSTTGGGTIGYASRNAFDEDGYILAETWNCGTCGSRLQADAVKWEKVNSTPAKTKMDAEAFIKKVAQEAQESMAAGG